MTHLSDYDKCNGSFTDVNGRKHPRNIFDIDGSLRCVIDFKKRPNNDKYDPGSLFDVISVTQVTLQTGGTQTTWRIDRPQVWHNVPQGEVDYPMISFHAGDQISFAAGGCVQTGGHGRTWKRYVNPEGPSKEEYYSGTVSIPGGPSGFARIGRVASKNYAIPAPHLGLPNILRLGYLDNQLDDNGYYKYDDGDGDQCTGQGLAWVEVAVRTGTKGSRLSPHLLPFDLVWNVDLDEDENGLPMNPQWNWALEHWDQKNGKGAQPHLIPLCGAAFHPLPALPHPVFMIGPGTEEKLAQICTSMPFDFDTHLSFGYCPADPISGHMNFTIATYTGQITWDSASDPQSAFSDGDWSFDLTRPDGAGLAGQDDTTRDGTSLHLEFNAGEVPLALMPFWSDVLKLEQPFAVPIGDKAMDNEFDNPNGLRGVVIGLVGLDGVHGGFTEIHPVYALAVRIKTAPVAGHPDLQMEKWAFFLRNFGDEGFCSHNEWPWPKQPEYFISLPWPENGTELESNATGVVVPWQDASTPVNIEVDKARRFTLIRVGSPGVDQFGVGGTLDLFYKITGAPKQRRTPVAGTSATSARPSRPILAHPEDDDGDIKGLSDRIADPALRARFEAAMKALPPMTEPRKFTKAASVQVTATMTERKHVPGAASKGMPTLPRPIPNMAKQRWAQEMYNVLKTYQKDLKIELPAPPPQAPNPNSVQASPK